MVMTPSSARVLIADDEQELVVSTSRLLSLQGYSCDCAYDTAGVLQMLGIAEYDGLLVSAAMAERPELDIEDGFDCRAAALPIILMLGPTQTRVSSRVFQRPVLGYLTKPPEPEQLYRRMRDITEYQRARRSLSHIDSLLTNCEKSFELHTCSARQRIDAGALDTYEFTALSLKNIADALQDLTQVFGGMLAQTERDYACRMLNCPRLERLKSAIEMSASVLESTKGSFKSKALGILREELEQVLAELDN